MTSLFVWRHESSDVISCLTEFNPRKDQTERIAILERENPDLQKKLDTYESELNGLKRKLEFYQSLDLKTEWFR